MKIFSAQLKGTTIVASGSSATITGSFTGSIAGIDINATNTFTSSTIARLNSIETITSSNVARLNAIETITSSNIARLNSIETISASNISRIGSLETISASNISRIGSIETITASNVSRLNSLEIKTGSLATTGSNFFSGSQTITGSLYISADLIVQGSSSLQNITASAVSIGTNLINLNTANPAIRYAGLVIGDSGSVGGSGSFLYDSVQDEMIFVHRGTSTIVTSSVTLMGPQTFDNIGSETYPTSNIIQKGTGKEHLVDSCIFDNGTTTCIKNDLIGTGTACFSNNVCALNLISKCNIRVGVNGGYSVISGPTTGAAISLGTNSATFDRNLSLGLVGFDLSFSPILTINAQTGNVGIGICTPDRRLYITDTSVAQGTFLAYNQCTTFCGTVIEGITDRTSSSAFNLMNLKASTTSMFIVRGDGFSCYGGQVCVPTLIASSCLAVKAGTPTIVINAIAGASSNNHITLQRNDSQYASIGLNGTDNFTIFGTSTSSPRLTIDSTGNICINNSLTSTVGDGCQSLYLNGSTGKFHIFPYYAATEGALINSYNSAISGYKPMTFQASNYTFLQSQAILLNQYTKNYLGTPNRYGIEVNGGAGGAIYALNISGTAVGYIFHDNSILSIYNDKSGGPVKVGPRFNNNGLQEQVFVGKMGGTTATSWDFCSFDEGGEGQVYKVEATFAHFAGWSYNTFYESYAAARGTTVNTIDICNYATAQAGSFSVMKPTGSIFRVCKLAGSYPGTGWYWIKVTAVGPGF